MRGENKKRQAALLLALCLCLLAGCGSGTASPEPSETPEAPQPEVPERDGAAETTPSFTKVCRVVTVNSDGSPDLLAELEGGPGAVFRMERRERPDTDAEQPAAEPGTVLEITCGIILETYPGVLSEITAVDCRSDGFDDRCRLYLEALEELWNKDSGLNSGVEQAGMDLSGTRLTESERSAVGWAFSEHHRLELVEGSWQDLTDRGYLTGKPVSDREDAKFWQWENGCHFCIVEKEFPGEAPDLRTVTFDAEKWRSSLAAYILSDCVSVQAQDGHWGPYSVGAEIIA